jgi:hypothetical protein
MMGTDAVLECFGGALAVGGVAVLAAGRRELINRWFGWVLCAAVLGTGMALGRPGAAVLAAVLSVVGAIEYARLQRLPVVDALLVAAFAGGLPAVAWLAPAVTWRALLGGAVLLALAPVLAGDAASGGQRAARISRRRRGCSLRGGTWSCFRRGVARVTVVPASFTPAPCGWPGTRVCRSCRCGSRAPELCCRCTAVRIGRASGCASRRRWTSQDRKTVCPG